MNTKKNQNCVICLEPISNDAGVIDCGHIFCAKCIKQWCEQSSSCPLCRKEITEIKLYYRSFYMEQKIKVEHKKQKSLENDDQQDESDFVVPDSAEILISSQDMNKETQHYEQENIGTAWIGGSRHSLREQHQPNKGIEQRLMKLKLQLEK